MILNYNKVLENLKNNIPFSYARYGDGEWNAILGKVDNNGMPKANCDNHKYFPQMGKRLKQIIDNKPNYYIGLQSLAKKQNTGKPEFDRLIKKNKWCNTEIFTKASINGNLHMFFDVLKGKKIIFVTNKHTSDNLNEFFHAPVYVPEINCWNEYDRILSDINKNIKKHDVLRTNIIILYSASMMANVLIGDIYAANGNTITQIDTGSVFDPYVGRNTRSYHKNLKVYQ